MPKILLVDDEDMFRVALAKRLNLRGYETVDVNNGEDAVKIVRNDRDIDVVVLDLKMPEMDGKQTLKVIKEFRPELQVIILTGHGSLDSAIELGKMDAFSYLAKPVEFNKLIEAITDARQEKVYASQKYEVVDTSKVSLGKWLLGSHNSRPLYIFIGMFLFILLVLIPVPERLLQLISAPKTEQTDSGQELDINSGYSDYRRMKPGENIADYYSAKYKLKKSYHDSEGNVKKRPLNPLETGKRAKVMLAIIVVAALFWATGAVPVGVAALLIGVCMYFFGVLKPDGIAQAYAKDAVIFVFGVLAMSKAITKTGLDRRIGLLLLAPAKNIPLLLLVFLPMLSMTCSFVSEHALVAFTMPIFVMVYANATRTSGVKVDRSLMVMFALSLCYAANSGGPGSPAAGGRNAIMIGILGDYGLDPTFAEWVKYGLPLVPVMSFFVGLYFLLVFRSKLKIKKLDVSSIVRKSSAKIGPMNRDEYVTAAVLICVILLWILKSDTLGMGGPVLLGLVALNFLRVLKWRDMASIHWEVVFLYGGASAIGTGLAVTGGALFLADGFLHIIPEFMKQGEGLAIATSLFTGLCTNFMSDGATVAAIGPITVPMATIANVHPWMVGFATAYASSFAHMLIIGTPSNALAFALAKDPVTGEQLVTLVDFFKHGAAVLCISFLVLWGWAFLGYWRFFGFPAF